MNARTGGAAYVSDANRVDVVCDTLTTLRSSTGWRWASDYGGVTSWKHGRGNALCGIGSVWCGRRAVRPARPYNGQLLVGVCVIVVFARACISIRCHMGTALAEDRR